MQQETSGAIQPFEIIQCPQAVHHKAMWHIRTAWTAIIAEQEGLLRLFRIITAAHHDRSLIRRVIYDL